MLWTCQREFPKALLANANERTLSILFWVFLFSTMVNTLSTTSAIILAWMSNNRAKAELRLKQAEALLESKERELRIKELELKLAHSTDRLRLLRVLSLWPVHDLGEGRRACCSQLNNCRIFARTSSNL